MFIYFCQIKHVLSVLQRALHVLNKLLFIYVRVRRGTKHNRWQLLFFRICLVGDRLLKLEAIKNDFGEVQCNSSESGPIYQLYCGNATGQASEPTHIEACTYFHDNPPRIVQGIPGLASGMFSGKNHLWGMILHHRIISCLMSCSFV